MELKDNHGRAINYVRLAVTDRCNLRCFYCMPESGINYVKKDELLSFEEMERLMRILVPLGINKVRITGGEPFVRKEMMDFLGVLSKMPGLEKISITTNGTVTAPLVGDLKHLGIHSVNLSLDTLDKHRFFQITRRDLFDEVMSTLWALLDSGIKTRINAVVMEGQNIEDIIPMVALTENYPIDVRFIEEMPFNGSGLHYDGWQWNHIRILEHIRAFFPSVTKIPDPPHSTSYNYAIPGFQGTIGIIAAYSRTFCGTCNRIRVTPQGTLKTCLYDDGVFNLRDFMRAGCTDNELKETFLQAVNHRAKDGWEAEKGRLSGKPVHESMATIGG
jgi:molybdenum cofactor biosynthesis protein A